MRTYLAGPITGVAHYREHFARAARELEAAGHTVVNPALIEERDDWEWADYMRAALTLMLTCRRVAVLPGWQASRGARLELNVAHWLGMDVRVLESWTRADA